jgi:hypothetical protein
MLISQHEIIRNVQLDISKKIEMLRHVLNTGKFDCADEIRAQNQISVLLQSVGVDFHKEYRLEEGIVDFFLPKSQIAIEVKANKQWSKMKVFRQCERYCRDERVLGLLLATAKSQTLPPTINGKPVSVFSLGATNI